MPRRLVIAVDCDDVLIETTLFLVRDYNNKFNTNVNLEDAHKPNNPDWGTDDNGLILDRLSEIQNSKEYAEIKPIAEAINAIHRLVKDNELHLITARDGSVEVATMAMLDRYFSGCFISVEHVGKARSKGEVCRQIKADILIDDNILHLLSALDYGMPSGGALHFGNYLWNQLGDPIEGVIECHNWEAVEREVHKIAER
jgi:5'(3')-deoxyribonucleotidase